MNWYKQAQEYYQEIGHFDPATLYFPKEAGQVDIWAFIDGRLHVVKNAMAEDTHMNLWGSEMEDTDYYGRFENKTKRCSIVIPDMYRGREIPNVILKALYNTFGPDIKIIGF